MAALVTVALQAGAVHAQESTIITYQGRLNDGAGPANGAYDLKFSIYDSTNQPGVLIAGPLTNLTVTVTNGLFTVPLDFGVAPFDGSDRWLQIAVRTNGAASFTTLAARQQITLAPYAIMSRAALFAVSNFTVGATLYLPPTNAVIYSGSDTLLYADSYEENFFAGPGAGHVGGQANTAVGKNALASDSSGGDNSAFGDGALSADTTGYANTAFGVDALSSDTNGYYNTAIGVFALAYNTSGNGNTAEGLFSLAGNLTGNDNTANGWDALIGNISGMNNTAVGAFSLLNNTNGGYNVAVGYQALYSNTSGYNNTALGENALYSYTGVGYNTALGDGALQLLTGGTDNIGIGDFGGHDLTTGSWNIHIGNPGTSSDDHTIKVGQQGTQSKTFIAGISGTSVSGGAPVYVTSSGQLGSVSPAFVQTATSGNIELRGTLINNALCNGKPNAILIVTSVNFLRDQIFVDYNGTFSEWEIIYPNQNMQVGDQFNVFVANP